MGKFTPSPEQQTIFDAVLTTSDNIAVAALPGTGKTWTLVELAKRVPKRETKLFCAFTKSNVNELEARLDGTGTRAKTFHSMGYGVLAKKLGVSRLNPDGARYKRLVDEWIAGNDALMAAIKAFLAGEPEDAELRGELVKGTARMFTELLSFLRVKLVAWDDKAGLDALIDEYGLDETFSTAIRDLVLNAVPEIMGQAETRLREQTELDFTDMIYWVVKWNLSITQYDWVFVDEQQDMSPMQRAMIQKSLKPAGRIVMVGDENQAVYGFTGADTDSFELSVKLFNAKVLPLTVTRRCASIVTRHAAELVPAFRALDTAVRGQIVARPQHDLTKMAIPGDMILCRTKAPLIGACLDLLAADKPATILGSDIGKALIALLNKVQQRRGFAFQDLALHLVAYKDEQMARWRKKDDEAAAQAVGDQCDALLVLYERSGTTSYDGLVAYVERLFSDEEKGGRIVLSTVHKAKGLEADRVMILAPEKLPLLFPGMRPEAVKQEHNLDYVARSRAKTTLVYLTNDNWPKSGEKLPPYFRTTFDDPVASNAGVTVQEPAPEPETKILPWAKELLQKDFVILDYETTGIAGEPVQIGIIDCHGTVLLNTLVNPIRNAIEPGAQDVHGIGPEQVEKAPTFVDLYARFRDLLQNKVVVAYNAAFEQKTTEYTTGLYGLARIEGITWECAMLAYARHNPSKRDKFGRPGGWWRLEEAAKAEGVTAPGKAHDALTDVYLTLGLVRKMAGAAEPLTFAPETPEPEAAEPVTPNTPHEEPDGTSPLMIENQRQVPPGEDWLTYKKTEPTVIYLGSPVFMPIADALHAIPPAAPTFPPAIQTLVDAMLETDSAIERNGKSAMQRFALQQTLREQKLAFADAVLKAVREGELV